MCAFFDDVYLVCKPEGCESRQVRVPPFNSIKGRLDCGTLFREHRRL